MFSAVPRNLRRIFVILTLATAGMAALLGLLPAAGHDQLWFLMMARRWLGGAQLYGPEIFDSNPPAIVWLSALPVMLARPLHVETTFAAKLLVILVESSASLLSYRFFRYGQRSSPDSLPQQDYIPAALLCAAMVLFYIVPARDLGQRDQMLSFLVLPYLLAAAIAPSQCRLTLARYTAGVLAGVGICLKPHQALIPIAVELALLLTPRPKTDNRQSTTSTFLRPEPVLIALIGLAYLAAIHRLTPLYFTVALPILRETYWAIGHLSPLALAWEAVELCLLAALCIILFVIYKPAFPAIRLLLVAGSAATLAYALQGTGWYYQQLPAICFFGSALTLQLLDLAARRPLLPPNWSVAATAALSLLALALTTHFTGYPFTRERAFAIKVPDPAFFSPLPSGTPVAILTTSVDAAMMPVERYRLTWAQRTNNLWMLPAILRTEAAHPLAHRLTPLTLARLEATQQRWMVEDLERWHPQLVLVERCQDPAVHCQELEDFDASHSGLLAFFLRDPAFAALWTRYTFAGARGPFDAYTLSQSSRF